MLSGYDSEAVGFDSIKSTTKDSDESSSQTTEFSANAASSQTTTLKTNSVQTNNTDTKSPEHIKFPQYDEIRLNEFLRKVVPSVYEALAENENEFESLKLSEQANNEPLRGQIFQIIENSELNSKISKSMGSGDQEYFSVLSMSWSSVGNTLAVSIGKTYHDDWCDHEGIIRVYTIKRSSEEKLCHYYDITEKNCITVLKYHPTVAALLAYGTISGEVVVHNLRNATSSNLGDGAVLTSPSGTHSSRRVSSIQWVGTQLSGRLLMLQTSNKGKRRGASDLVLISAGSDGTIIIWQANPNLDVFNSVICFKFGSELNSDKIMLKPDITCFDFMVSNEEQFHDAGNRFIVGCKSGQLIQCNTLTGSSSNGNNPTTGIFEAHRGCVLDIAFCTHSSENFISISHDGELRIYNFEQIAPLNIICVEEPLSCMKLISFLPKYVILGFSKPNLKNESLIMYNILGGNRIDIELSDKESGQWEKSSITTIAVNSKSQNVIATGDKEGNVLIWNIPIRKLGEILDDGHEVYY